MVWSALKMGLFFFSACIPVQAFPRQVRLGVKAGVVFSNATIQHVGGYDVSPKEKAGLTAGVFICIPVGPRLSFRPGAEMVIKGFRAKNNSATRFSYIDFPVNLLCQLKTKHEQQVLVGGGPVLSCHFNRNWAYKLVDLDMGINLMAGYEWPIGASLNVNYTQGFMNVSADKTFVSNIRNRYFGVTVGYLF